MKVNFVLVFLVLAIICLAIVEGQKQENKNKKQNSNSNTSTSSNKKPSKENNKKGQNKKQQQRPRNRKRFITTEIPGLGKVKGKPTETAWTGKTIWQYFDIKYGETTSGKNRFKAPIPAQRWEGIRRATQPRNGCPSLKDIDWVETAERRGVRDFEDCLTLTISTKSFETSAPVMVYLHGNYLYDGTPNEANPEYLLEKDIVLVSVRYRLGPFGFLSTQTEQIPGNAAVKDVILALEWIQQYIDIFGGDPKRVTLFGEVGGAAIANVLTMSPIVPDGIFHQVIYQSGTALTPAFITDNPIDYATEIAKYAGCTNINTIKSVNKCLRRANATSLLEAFNNQGINSTDNGIGKFGGAQFVIGGPSGVLPDHPGKLIQEKKIKYYPTMGGVVKNPGTFVLRDIFEEHFNFSIPDDKYKGQEYIDYIIAHTNGDDPTGQWKKFSEKEFFTKDELRNGSFAKMLPGLIDMCSTIPFKNPILLTLQANAEKLPKNTFLYSFNYEGEYHRYQPGIEDGEDLPFELGVSLTDENIYLFRWPQYASYLNVRDVKMAKTLTDLWTSFAINGIPKSDRVPLWPPMTEGSGPYMKIDRVSSVQTNFLDEYSATVREDRVGLTLISEAYFENIEDYEPLPAEAENFNANSNENEQQAQEDDDDDDDYDENSVVPTANQKLKKVDDYDDDDEDDDDDKKDTKKKEEKVMEKPIPLGDDKN